MGSPTKEKEGQRWHVDELMMRERNHASTAVPKWIINFFSVQCCYYKVIAQLGFLFLLDPINGW